MSSLGQEPSSQKTQVADDPRHQDLSVEQEIDIWYHPSIGKQAKLVIARRKDLSSACIGIWTVSRKTNATGAKINSRLKRKENRFMHSIKLTAISAFADTYVKLQ